MAKWIKITECENIPSMGSRVVQYGDIEIAIFKTRDDSIFAINNECPHKQGKLSEGLVHESVVTCPMHNWDIDLASGEVLGNDSGCTNVYESKIEAGIFYINI
ncbi:nitrite reductase small subunit NirD [Poseidonibacter ostreae]|jgi:nitrite reductase (NADH) small subunit|uniref:Nitrite reductase small subunit NirD n=1 Tax=Poseidonibacter ostreae TaxID=2654171 RepID=A0A6L4WTG3_9BACT|nr:nitrite reductase small subunit NirD [Poseidonibacter ostreae]KAB7885912.1 nitrite reductase small subunit NirD [Poseidonibacter ostreae]KAB7889389.1 nitrite reductase small subunit NirD [Poseidonibacter ostreae]KAB7891665.1 nitrite reductase small subunit NirD [Poseidonibacter ostreae]